MAFSGRSVPSRGRLLDRIHAKKAGSANFLLLRYDKAKELNERLLNYGIGVRSFGNAPMLDNCLRISIGTPEENNAVMKAIRDFAEGR